MSERQTPETVERSSDPSRVNKDRAQGWGSDDTKVDAIRTVTLYPGSENPQEAISPFGWLSASILHDLRNPLGTICAGAEQTQAPESPIVSAIGCSNRLSPPGSRMGWDLGSRSRVRLFATTAATYGRTSRWRPFRHRSSAASNLSCPSTGCI